MNFLHIGLLSLDIPHPLYRFARSLLIISLFMQRLPTFHSHRVPYTHGMTHIYNPWCIGQSNNYAFTAYQECDDSTVVRSVVTATWRILLFLYSRQCQGYNYWTFNPSEVSTMPSPDCRRIDPVCLTNALQAMDALHIISRHGVNYYEAWPNSSLFQTIITPFIVSFQPAMQGRFPSMAIPHSSSTASSVGSDGTPTERKTNRPHIRLNTIHGRPPFPTPELRPAPSRDTSDTLPSPCPLERSSPLRSDSSSSTCTERELMDEGTSKLCFKHEPPYRMLYNHCAECEVEQMVKEHSDSAGM